MQISSAGKPKYRHFWISQDKTSLYSCEYNSDETPNYERKTNTISLSDIKQVIMGQYLEGFQMYAKKNVVQRPGKTKSKDKMNDDEHYSFSLTFKNSPVAVNLIADEKYFEYWIIGLRELLNQDPVWGAPMDLTICKDRDQLDDEELRLCMVHHVQPHIYLAAKHSISKFNGFVTAFDLRKFSELNLLQCIKIVEYWVSKNIIKPIL